MNTRPAWGVLTLGALVAVGLLLSPIWLDQFSGYFAQEETEDIFPPAFYDLPREQQDWYTKLYTTDEQMAIDFVAASLTAPTTIEDENLPVTDPNPGAVVEFLSGNFITIDPIRLATGSASVYRLSNGRYIVRLQNLDAINGPDLHVLLTSVSTPTTDEMLAEQSQFLIDLGALKGDEGNQNYFIEEPTFNIDNYTQGSVVLYSTRYDVVFSFAPLTPTEAFGQ